jgi:hypothetical protein
MISQQQQQQYYHHYGMQQPQRVPQRYMELEYSTFGEYDGYQSYQNGANGASENGNGFRSPNAGFEDFSGESGYPQQQQQPQQQPQQQWYTNAGTYGYYGDGDR